MAQRMTLALRDVMLASGWNSQPPYGCDIRIFEGDLRSCPLERCSDWRDGPLLSAAEWDRQRAATAHALHPPSCCLRPE